MVRIERLSDVRKRRVDMDIAGNRYTAGVTLDAAIDPEGNRMRTHR